MVPPMIPPASADQPQRAAIEDLTAKALLSSRPILFVVRHQYKPDHHNTATMFQTGEINTASFQGGGAIKTIHFGRGGEVTTLLEVPEGVARDVEVRFDGRKILFSMRRDRADDYHIYEMDADGTALKQLTFGSGVSDIDPIYLPSGQILFSSTREPKYCMCNRHIMCNLFTMDADGANIEQIGHSTLHEGPCDVVARRACHLRPLGVRRSQLRRRPGHVELVNPDGTNHAIYWGNNTNSPGGCSTLGPSRARSAVHRHVLVLPRSAVGRAGDGRPAAGASTVGSPVDPYVAGQRDRSGWAKATTTRFTRVKPKYEDPISAVAKSTSSARG